MSFGASLTRPATFRKQNPAEAGFRKLKLTDKPGSVVDSHSSRPAIAHWLKQPTRVQYGPYHVNPIWPCSGWSLPCHGLLPAARCALTAPFHPYLIPLARAIGGLLSVALVVGFPRRYRHPALWSRTFLPPPVSPKGTTTKRRLSGQLRRAV